MTAAQIEFGLIGPPVLAVGQDAARLLIRHGSFADPPRRDVGI